MFITKELKKKAEEALLKANGADMVQIDQQVLVKLGSEKQVEASRNRMSLGSFIAGEDTYILYNK
jgi:hypothetical protein